MQKIAVPKFSVVLFHAHIVHKVAGSKRKAPLIRLFVGHRLTTHAEPLFKSASAILKKSLSRPAPTPTAASSAAAGTVATGATGAGAGSTTAAAAGADSSTGTKAATSAGKGLKRKRSTAAKAPAVVEGVESPSLKDVFKKFRGPPLPSGQQFPIISAFAYGMHKAKKYAWLSERYKPDLFGLDSWPSEPLPWSKIGYMNPQAASALLEGVAVVPVYTKDEKRLHEPHPLEAQAGAPLTAA